MTAFESNQAIQNFREYLQIPSVHPNINYEPCVEFLKKMAHSLQLPIKVHEVATGKPVVIITWVGKEPLLPSVLLNSHMDVVPVFQESWIYPPFSAHMDESGKIFGRGSQDMKCVGIQFIEAIRELKNGGSWPKRTIHMTFVPDEELSGGLGMGLFVKTREFELLNVGVAIDEGIASTNDTFLVFYGERAIWQMMIHCTGTAGHGSLLHSDTAGEKIRYVIDRFMDYRQSQVKILEENPHMTIGDVTSVNLTKLEGGVQANVVPEMLTVGFDVRLAVTVNHEQFENLINSWCREAGEGITIEYEYKGEFVPPTVLEGNKFWTSFKEATDELGLILKTEIFTGGTDSTYLREIGVPAFGFSPMNNTPILLHAHNEFLSADTFLRGIHIYKTIIERISDVHM